MKGEGIMNPMEMLDRYLYDVGRRLPAKQREDIEKELKSLLLDALEARTGGAKPTEADMAAVLKEFGSPEVVATRYEGEKYVIGPRLYPFYRMVLWIVTGALALGLFISVFVGYVFAPGDATALGSRVLQFLGSLVSGVWGAIGVVTVIFWGIERGLAHKAARMEFPEPWDPKALQPVPKHNNPWKPADSIAAIVFTLIAMVLFNGIPELFGIYSMGEAGQLVIQPVISSQALQAYLPLWNIGWALSLALHAVLLAQGRWRMGTHLASIALKLYDIVVVIVMMTGPALLNTSITIGGNDVVMKIVQAQFRWIFLIIIIVSVVEIGKTVYRIVKDRT